MMRVLHVAESDGHGGAARAAFRIHRALAAVEDMTGVETQMLVRRSLQQDPQVIQIRQSAGSRMVERLAEGVARAERRFLATDNQVLHSVARTRTHAPRQIRAIRPDAVVLHWLGDSVMSIAQVGALAQSGVPLFWVLHDAWAFCGAEHYPHVENDQRFAEGYRASNRPIWESGLDVNRRTWNRKNRNWTHAIRIVAPSQWMAGLARSSALMREWPIDVVPNPIDVKWWGALSRDRARRELAIAGDRRVILYGAVGGESDPRKGADLLREALAHLSRDLDDEARRHLCILTFGAKERVDTLEGLKIRCVGRLDDTSLRRYYSAADVAVVPSRIDNLPQTAVEPIVCGTPVVAFRVGGLSDIVVDRVTGRLVEPFSTRAMSDAIRWVISDDSRRRSLSNQARESANRWSEDAIGLRFSKLFTAGRDKSRDRQGEEVGEALP